jgi:hypothetical protein
LRETPDRLRDELDVDTGRKHPMTTIRDRTIPVTLRRMSTEDVAAWCDSFEQGSANHILGQMELQRRRDHGLRIRIWIAIGLSVCALIVSSVALFVSAR